MRFNSLTWPSNLILLIFHVFGRRYNICMSLLLLPLAVFFGRFGHGTKDECACFKSNLSNGLKNEHQNSVERKKNKTNNAVMHTHHTLSTSQWCLRMTVKSGTRHSPQFNTLNVLLASSTKKGTQTSDTAILIQPNWKSERKNKRENGRDTNKWKYKKRDTVFGH